MTALSDSRIPISPWQPIMDRHKHSRSSEGSSNVDQVCAGSSNVDQVCAGSSNVDQVQAWLIVNRKSGADYYKFFVMQKNLANPVQKYVIRMTLKRVHSEFWWFVKFTYVGLTSSTNVVLG